jgi:hypothetical protein
MSFIVFLLFTTCPMLFSTYTLVFYALFLQERGRDGGLFAPVSAHEAALARCVLERAGSRDDPEVQMAAALFIGTRKNLTRYWPQREAPLDNQAAAV